MNNKKILAPELRFKGFNSDWEKRELKDFTKINQGLQIAISERFSEQVDESLFYITNEFLRKGSKKSYFIKNPPQSVICDEDDLLMTRTGNTGQVVTGVQGAFHNNFFKIKFDSSCEKWFLFYFLTSYRTQHTILKLAGTSTIPDLNHGDFYNIKINIPDFPEKQKIASFLSAVDKKIQHLTRKKELLEQYKKGVMQQLFSGKLRFKEENGKAFPKWEEKRLGDVGNIVTGKTPSTTDLDLWNGEIQFVTPTDINNNKYQLSTQRTIKELASTRLLPAKSIMFTCIASIGKMSLSIRPCITNQQINSVVPYKEFDNEFVYYSVLNISEYIKSTQSTTTLPIINKTEFSKFKINIPSAFEEQKKIANYLSNIDNKIEIVNKQITQTQTFKKGLLQQMFV